MRFLHPTNYPGQFTQIERRRLQAWAVLAVSVVYSLREKVLQKTKRVFSSTFGSVYAGLVSFLHPEVCLPLQQFGL